MTPIEAMARAIWRVSDRSETYEREADFWQEKARAALVALRDCGVTPAMAAARFKVARYGAATTASDWTHEDWRAMLDAAIEGE